MVPTIIVLLLNLVESQKEILNSVTMHFLDLVRINYEFSKVLKICIVKIDLGFSWTKSVHFM